MKTRPLTALLAAAALVACAQGSLLPGRRHVGALNEMLLRRGVDVHAEAASPEDDGALYFGQQLVDHFDYKDNRTWSQKYYLNKQYWTGEEAPIFLMLGGEGPISASYNGPHFNVLNLAKQAGAMLVSIEHRYYSANHTAMPTPDTDDNLYLLTTEQALADTALFAQFINNKYGAQNAKWIVFGGSYSGAMALWARAKYPSVFAGAWGTSGPVVPQTDFRGYLEQVQESVGPACAARLREGSAQLSELLFSRQGREEVDRQFSTCQPLETTADAITFYSNVVGVVSGVVQYNNDNNKYQPFNITAMCNLLDQGETALDGLAGMLATANAFSGANCTDASYEEYVGELKATGAGRSWMYQCCSAFGFWQAADSPDQPFNQTYLPLKFYTRLCMDAFGPDVVPPQPQNNRVAVQFGSSRYQGDNVFAPYGGVDPWHRLGLAPGQDIGDHSATVLVPPMAHCGDLYPPRAQDPPSLTAARQQGWALMQKWLA